MTALSALVPSLKRELAVPGTFDDVFPDTGDTDLVDSLADGFAEAQLQGFFPDMALTAVDSDWTTSADLSASGGTLVTLFTAARILRAQIRALNTSERYKAGSSEVEFQRGVTILKDELAYIAQRLRDLIILAQARARGARSATVHDNYLARGGGITMGLSGLGPYGCDLYPHEYRA